MTPEQFVYWLQGFFELSESKSLTDKQVEAIKNHLNLVFFHSIDPKMEVQKMLNETIKHPPSATTITETKQEMNKIHNPSNPNVIYRC